MSVFLTKNVWIISILSSLIFDKTYFLQCSAKTNYPIDINICCNSEYIVNTSITRFLDTVIDTTLSWKKC